jgi:hypothetical protein
MSFSTTHIFTRSRSKIHWVFAPEVSGQDVLEVTLHDL